MSYEKHREIFATRMRLPESARYKHEPSETRRIAEEIMKQPNNPHSWDEAYGRALARQDAQDHQREKAAKLINSPKTYAGRVHKVIIGLLVLICLLLAHKAFGQSTAIRGVAKGTTPANSVTVEAVDSNTNAFPVTIKGGGGSGGGPADTAPNASASESDIARQKVTTVLRLLDVSLGAGVQLVTAKGTQAGGLWVECKVGCAGGATTPSDAFANPTTAGLQATFNMLYNGATWDRARGDTTNGLWVNCKNGCAGGSSTPSDAFANPTTAGLGMSFGMGWNGTTWDRLRTDVSLGLWVNIKNTSLPVTGTFWQATQPVSGTFWQATQPVSGTFWQATQPVSIAATVNTDPVDRAARLLGVVYGSQGQQLKQTAINFNLQVENAVGGTLIDPRSIRALTSADVVTAAQGAAAALASAWPTKVTDGTNTMPTMDVAARKGFVALTDGTNTAAVKAASTAPVATDPALVSTLSPNGNIVRIDQGTPGTTNGVRTDSSGATGSAPPTRAELNGFIGSGATGGFTTGAAVGDTYKNINIASATTTLLVTGVSGRQVRISAMHMMAAAAQTATLIEGTGATCGTGTAAMAGGSTSGTGYSFAANGGIAFGSGLGTVIQTATTGDSVCIITSTTGQLSGGLQYAIY